MMAPADLARALATEEVAAIYGLLIIGWVGRL